ncbi:hypothetical protein IWQ61_009109 [Dispira simplex]|nr:hypothetical protein IWQ61_009109 [Dispira simplex]
MTTPPQGTYPMLHVGGNVYRTLMISPESKPHLREFSIHHELWHIVSNRLVGGSFNTECLLTDEARAIAEGLSDGLPAITILVGKSKQGFVDLPSLKNAVAVRLYKRKADDAFIHGQRHVWDSFKKPKDLTRDFTIYLVFDIYWEYVNNSFHHNHQESRTQSTYEARDQDLSKTVVKLFTTAMMYMPCQPTLKDMFDALLFAQITLGHDDPCLVWRPFHEWMGDQLKTIHKPYDDLVKQCSLANSYTIVSA